MQQRSKPSCLHLKIYLKKKKNFTYPSKVFQKWCGGIEPGSISYNVYKCTSLVQLLFQSKNNSYICKFHLLKCYQIDHRSHKNINLARLLLALLSRYGYLQIFILTHQSQLYTIFLKQTETSRKLSNFNFKWTKTLYQNILKNIALM